MKKVLAVLFLGAACSLFAQKYLYTVELTPDNLADIDPRQNVCLKDIGNQKKAILVLKTDSSWLYLKSEFCLGSEIIVSFRYKAAEKGKIAKNIRAVLRYAKGEVYCEGPAGTPVILPVGMDWKTGKCSMKFPVELEDAMISFHAKGENILVTDIKVHKK